MRRRQMMACLPLCLLPALLALPGCAVEPLPGAVVVRERVAPVVWEAGRWNRRGTWEHGYWRW